jgi:hypothetical protein
LEILESDEEHAFRQRFVSHCRLGPGHTEQEKHERQQQHDVTPGRPAVVVAAIVMRVLVIMVVMVIASVRVNMLSYHDAVLVGVFMTMLMAVAVMMFMIVIMHVLMVVVVITCVRGLGFADGHPKGDGANDRQSRQHDSAQKHGHVERRRQNDVQDSVIPKEDLHDAQGGAKADHAELVQVIDVFCRMVNVSH